ncbi:MAG: hypothetical protein Q8N31_10515 [Reyranella sp.]|nr:hypothetical protein [Reyranella sp.]
MPVGSLGALQLQQEGGALPASTITSAYDELGCLSGRTVAGAETFQYPAAAEQMMRTMAIAAAVHGCGNFPRSTGCGGCTRSKVPLYKST